MKGKALESILTERLGAEEDDGSFRIPKDKEVTALLKTGEELLHVQKLLLVEFGDDATTLVTKQAEYFVDTDDIFALKLEGSRLEPHDARPGFRRE